MKIIYKQVHHYYRIVQKKIHLTYCSEVENSKLYINSFTIIREGSKENASYNLFLFSKFTRLLPVIHYNVKIKCLNKNKFYFQHFWDTRNKIQRNILLAKRGHNYDSWNASSIFSFASNIWPEENVTSGKAFYQ